jgi:cyclophilin family peptidyl-prolyl cis-trans isomerase
MRLPPQYALFGKLIDGFEVLEAIQTTATGPGDRPVEPVTIESVTITES